MKILAAMSGGVDSAVAAARAVEAGHDVVGVHLALSRMPGTLRTGSRGCCTIEDSMDARRVCDQLGIPFYVWDFSERFKEDVVDDFISEYEHGRTPNPCMRCNEKIKFAALLEKAVALGFDAVVTGHYAKVITNEEGNRELHRAADWAKDQSYVLGVLTHEQLKHAWFPLAETPSKAEVRAEAERRGFSVAKKPDSYDICFIPEGDTRDWLADHIEMTAGDIKDTEGTVLGQHDGSQAFTVGQRKGLKIGRPAPDGKPRFVLEIRPKTNEVIVGSKELLAVEEIRGIRCTWAGEPVDAFAQFLAQPAQIGAASTSIDITAQVRAHADPVLSEAYLEWVNDDESAQENALRLEVVVRLKEGLRGVAPGQTLVMYQGTRVLGQATINRAYSLDRADI
ncbi:MULTISPECIES: tRNA 2-thiouridine(34) synthase MnmA [unclassified Rothia (in: high G+C Gram-positive bacteria)]|uniref:tRNA 2-thiouridine(34) synthase MnmA n=1 Tax=unclassified Rothia (in: high G+C Gram-positive bacteria) TaxID=2689056 RepID=UPI001958E88D|nr:MULTISPECIES: tRNA 2-thiouridine(34) synthase MnmA [unclassified Rothia (in: high G+C Gram-positive bacteria)]MBM7050853.1 tRNA 2-thiouridine(34) synthase MnmA [Rothia sp. ZJ1223]QRZ61027.1 tRNA 2-thiouridine(34) synthase MnmA [Rothia sp. ZJ932]